MTDPFGPVEAYLAQAHTEIGRAFWELTQNGKAFSDLNNKPLTGSPPKYGSLDEIGAWADLLAQDLELVLSETTHEVIPPLPDHTAALPSNQIGNHVFQEGTVPTLDPAGTTAAAYKPLLTVRYSSLPPRAGQECQKRTAGLFSTRYRRRSWPPERQRPLWEDRRTKRQLTRDVSVQTNTEPYRGHNPHTGCSMATSYSQPSSCHCVHSQVFESANGINTLQDPTVDSSLVLPSQHVYKAKQAYKVQTSSFSSNQDVSPRVRSGRTVAKSENLLQYVLWKGSPYARITLWKSDDEEYHGLEHKELAKTKTDQMSGMVDSSITSLVSRHELESFLRKVEKSTYRPPSMEAKALHDAGTQTSTNVSPSSSFTWVTEDCECGTLLTTSTQWRLSTCTGHLSSSSLFSSSSSSCASTPPPSTLSSSSSSRASSSSPAPLASKSASAPMLRPQNESPAFGRVGVHNRGPTRAHSDRQLTELEAVEACAWLRQAGFPQYAQMYEDNQFPIDIGGVRKDHHFLDPDAIYSLFRRLNTLNKCARLKNTDGFPRKSGEDDSDDQCALSENWQFQQSNKRWSRVVLTVPNPAEGHTTPPRSPRNFGSYGEAQSEDSVFTDETFLIVPTTNNSPDSFRRHSPHCHTKGNLLAVMTLEADTCQECMEHSHSSLSPHDRSSDMLRRSGSERLKDGARALLRRVESLKGKRKKNREVVIIGGPAGDNKATIVTSGSTFLVPETKEVEVVSPDASVGSSSMGGTPQIKHRKGIWIPSSSDNSTSFSDSECVNSLSLPVGDRKRRNEGDGSSSSLEEPNNNVRRRTASFKRSQKEKDLIPTRLSVYDNVPSAKEETKTSTTQLEVSSQESVVRLGAPGFQEALELVVQQQKILSQSQRRDSGVGASLTRQFSFSMSSSPSCWHCFLPQSMNNSPPPFRVGSPVASLSVHQCNLLRKVSFLKATTVADKHCPGGKHANWNWGVTRLIKKMKTPDYKDKTVFGVPLSMVVQRNGGQPLPPPIQTALIHLHATAMDAQGLFRKSGVRSRIQRLRQQSETHGTLLSQASMQTAYEQQQSYDVADMVKQYFREVPDSMLTPKQSEILINVYQYVPEEDRLTALRMCILYLPDENREALQCLLHLLHRVAINSEVNQMSASNLGVCLAPSLFQLGSSGPASSPYSRSSSSSPRRRRTTTRENSGNNHNNTLGPGLGSGGMPDQRELDQSRAAHTCLTHMILFYKKLFLVPEEAGSYQRLSCSDQAWEPINMPEFGNQWQTVSEQATQDLMRECHDKSRLNGSWSSVSLAIGGMSSPWEGVDVWQRKVGDGHPLKLWKVCVDVEAPPADILQRLLNERSLWDPNFVEGRVLSQLDDKSDVYIYWMSSVMPLPLRQFCLLRSWRQERGHCLLVEASVEHPDAPPVSSNQPTQREDEDDMEEEPELIVGAIVLASRYLLEPCGAGRTRVTHISRTDFRGRSIDWYNSFYGHLIASLMSRLRDSFRHGIVGPETKV